MLCCFKKQKLTIINDNLKFVKNLYIKRYRSIKLYKDDNNKYFIIKVYNNIDLFRNELDILSTLYHKNIINIVDSKDMYDTGYLKLPYYKNGDLFEYFQQNFPLTLDKIKFFFIKILNIINYCHNKNIVHSDIKLENFVLDSNFSPILIDFEHSRIFTDKDIIVTNFNITGTIPYIAPECFLFQIGYCSDIWSLGCLLYRLYYGYGPLDEYLIINNNMIHYCDWDILKLYIKYPKKITINKSLQDLLIRMLEPYPKKRITLSQILKHPFIIQ